MNKVHALMIQGTASHVGKSVITAAFGLWLQRLGLRTAPFKAQNMSLNSFVTLEGEEIARSQAAQAQALGLEPSADMNPILLKPMNQGCQVIVQGHGIGTMSIHEYYTYKDRAWSAIQNSYDRLASRFDAIILEGAGSPAEINLKANDLVNMRMAHKADAPVILVADIERGGVFAQLVGTWELLASEERARVAGFLINKFRGDESLLKSGLDYIRQRTGKPILGVLPYDTGVQMHEEDSLGIPRERPQISEINIAVVLIPGLSNFTDFAPLSKAPSVSVRYVTEACDLYQADLIIVPGTRTTASAIDWLRMKGMAKTIADLSKKHAGPLVIGVCGGYQILGQTINDPNQVESTDLTKEGLGLLEVDTIFEPEKCLFRVQGNAEAAHGICWGAPVIGYEVHQGKTHRRNGTSAWFRLRRQPGDETCDDGAVSDDGRIAGTYIHSLFDDTRFCRSLIDTLRTRRNLCALQPQDWHSDQGCYRSQLDHLSNWLTMNCNLEPIHNVLGLS